jgi:hypothetical protein
MTQFKKKLQFGGQWLTHSLAIIIFLGAAAAFFTIASAGPPLDIGYLGYSFGASISEAPTGEKPESKLWWNDDIWWGSLYNPTAGEYRIHYMDFSTQDWVDTGVFLDEREDSRADVLWDAGSGKLYVATHVKQSNPGSTNNPDNWGRLLRFSYDADNHTYTLDAGFPVTVNGDRTEALVIDKDNTGRLWVAYTSRPPASADYQVYVNYTTTPGDDTAWGTPFTLPFSEAHVGLGDISSLIAFNDDGGGKVGVMWSNNVDSEFYFASHPTNVAPTTDWTLEGLSVAYPSNDHISLATTTDGKVLAAIKTFAVDPTDPLVAVIGRDSDGTFSFHPISTVSSNDTRPTMLIDDSANEAYVFVASNVMGGRICYHKAEIAVTLTNTIFPLENCMNIHEFRMAGQADAQIIIADETYSNFNNATTSKHNVTDESGILVLASDDDNGHVYGHASIGIDAPPPPPDGESALYLPLLNVP